MSPKNFIINELRIHPECNEIYTKVLKDKSYRFNQLGLNEEPGKNPLERNIFGKGIFIQTIVGKNGSGKSSVLELVYRIINNFSYFILKGTRPRRPSAEPVYLIEQIYADLYFIIDDIPCCFQVRDQSFGIVRGEERIYFGEKIEEFKDYALFDGNKKDSFIKLASSYFYTIATNYSFQSLISHDFDKDIVTKFISSEGAGAGSGGNWLDNLFRKNDGYITPIVLNPFRENGVIDLQREYFLTLSRISALLIQAKYSGRELLEGYELAAIRYETSHSHFLKKLFRKYNESDDTLHLGEIRAAINDPKSVAAVIITAYDLKIPVINTDEEVVPYAYLIYKTLSVLSKYEQFNEFENIPGIRDFGKQLDDKSKISLREAIEEIKRNRSHVNIKIIQTLNYIRNYEIHVDKLTLDQYIPYIKKTKFKNLDDIIENLPPPFFQQEIWLYRDKNYKKEIKLSSLSSGERQFIYTVSTIVYHTKNLLSVQQSSRIRYRNINLVLDEVEICFHPEYQRKFVGQLIELFRRLNLTRNCSFNIIIVTHSPFILSDIPKNNILYMADGEQVREEGLINPFAANLNDILYQSFFLEGGFIGEHAKDTINQAVNTMERLIVKQKVSKTSAWNETTLIELINMTGEPLLRDNLLGLYMQVYEQKTYEEQLEEKDTEIKRLQRLLEEKK
jgi:AAA15 family ATPase/GTPase